MRPTVAREKDSVTLKGTAKIREMSPNFAVPFLSLNPAWLSLIYFILNLVFKHRLE